MNFLARTIELALPNEHHLEPRSAQSPDRRCVPLSIAGELLLPEGTVRLRYGRFGATGVVVPEAALHEYSPVPTPVCEVRRAGQGANVLAVDEPELAQSPTDNQFGRRSSLSNATEKTTSFGI